LCGKVTLMSQRAADSCSGICRASDRERIGIFYAFKMPKTHWRWCRGLYIRFYKKRFGGVKMTPLICFIHLIMQEYDSKCLKMYRITLKVSKKIFKQILRRSPKSMNGSQIHLP
jgi:hypothetical protein